MITIGDILARLETERIRLAVDVNANPPLSEPNRFIFVAGQVAGVQMAVTLIKEMQAAAAAREDDDGDHPSQPLRGSQRR